jgi:A/G-specific adenine glycosylase
MTWDEAGYVTTFAQDVIAWQRRHGRNGLPWQKRDAYAVWVSEIMLQQTQVGTVIPYYERFMQRFPDVSALAHAPLDEVLAHWSGLGYYSRARNLHGAASILSAHHGGDFPRAISDVMALPGVGRSTAAAIMVFGFGERHAILDGNVKRVLARVCAIEGYPGAKRVADRLWEQAERFLPHGDVEAYTQGLMDLGASVCTRSRPRCGACPVSRHCVALAQGRVAALPQPRPRKVLPHKRCGMIVIEHEGALLLEKRSAPGIWGGLWCFPQVELDEDVAALCTSRYGVHVEPAQMLPTIDHGFTHFRLTISPIRMRATSVTPCAAEADRRWIRTSTIKESAVPAPVLRIVELLARS